MRLKFVLATILVLSFSLFAAAQEQNRITDSEQNKPSETRLFDEFGVTSHCDLGARIHNIFIELGENPGTRAYIIVYRGAGALPVAQTERTVELQIKRIKDQMMFLMLNDSLVEMVDGGFRDSTSILNEVWIIPDGGKIPQPSNTVEKPVLPVAAAYKADEREVYFDEARLEKFENIPAEEIETPSDESLEPAQEVSEEISPVENSETQISEISEVESDEYSEENDPYYWVSEFFAEKLKENKNLSGVVFFYADEAEYDIAKLRQSIDEGMRKLAERSAVDLSGVKVVYGGYREKTSVEFWIVPKGAKEPLPTPGTPAEK